MVRVLWKIVPKAELPSDSLFEIKKALMADNMLFNKYKHELANDVRAQNPMRFIEQSKHTQFYTINEVYAGISMRTTIARDLMNNEARVRIDCVFETDDETSST